jgi:four helix bundle protein
LALDYLDGVCEVAYTIVGMQDFSFMSQAERATTWVVLSIEDGSMGQSDQEQSHFVSTALRSCLETVVCFDVAERRQHVSGCDLQPARESGRRFSSNSER